MNRYSPLVEIIKQAMAFEQSFARGPTEVTMHPKVWYDLLNLLQPTDPIVVNSAGAWEIMGMRVIHDSQFPGTQIVVN